MARWQTENCATVAKSASQTQSAGGTETGSGSSASDDLTKIRGIGPATTKVLNANGIHRFEQLAEMSSQQLEDLFADMASRFKMQDRSTWPAQAKSFASQRGGAEDTEMEILEDINSIRAIASESNSTSDNRIKSDNS